MESTTEAGDTVVTAQDYYDSLQLIEKEADLILGGDKGEVCTYSRGYLPRQAVFSCVTCTPNGSAGICTACAINCHEHHEVLELWTKRSFRCDCGNAKFPSAAACKLQPQKDSVNRENMYSQNFCGLYCTCARPFPDPERAALGLDEDMIQCCVCEDWFHEEHLGLQPSQQPPVNEDGEQAYEDMICVSCVRNIHTILSCYKELIVPAGVDQNAAAEAVACKNEALHAEQQGRNDEEEQHQGERKGNEANGSFSEKASGDEEGSEDEHLRLKADHSAPCAPPSNLTHESYSNNPADPCHSPPGSSPLAGSVPGETSGTGAALATVSSDAVRPELTTTVAPGCPREAYLRAEKDREGSMQSLGHGNALFMKRGWRAQVCKCDGCKESFSSLCVPFLLNECDSLAAYEAAAEVKMENAEQGGDSSSPQSMMGLLNGFDRVTQLELIHGYNEMTSEMMAFLGSFRDGDKVVTREDILSFFDQLKSKRRKTNALA